MWKWSLPIFLVCFSLLAFGQSKTDSLWISWTNTALSDSSRVEALDNFIWEKFLFTDPDSALQLARSEFEFASVQNLKKQMAGALKTQGVALYMKGEYDQAIDLYKSSLQIYEELEDHNGIAASLNNIGLISNDQGNYAQAIDYYARSLAVYEKMENNEGIAIALNNIGLINYYLKNYSSAIENHNRSLTIREALQDQKGVAASLNNIGIALDDLGKHEEAIGYFNKSLTIKEEIEDRKGVASALNNIGLSHEKMENPDKAMEYYERSLMIRTEISDKKGMASSLINISSIHNIKGNYGQAISNCKNALELAKEIGSAIEIKRASHVLYEAYGATGKYDKALKMHELYMDSRDSILSEENQKKVISQEYKYAYDKKALADSISFNEKLKVQVAKYEKARVQRIALVAGLILFVGFSIILYNRFLLIKKQKQVIAKQNQELIDFSKIVSHDLKAPLGAIHGLAQLSKDYINEGNNDQALAMLDLLTENDHKMRHFIDRMLDYSRSGGGEADTNVVYVDLLIQNIKDILVIPNTIMLTIDKSIPPLKISATQLSQVFQNLISNAVKHVDDTKGEIHIGFEKNMNKLIFSVKDNGPGIPAHFHDKIFKEFEIIPNNKKSQTGIGLAIARKIVENHGGNIWVESELGVGSTFYFSLSSQHLEANDEA